MDKINKFGDNIAFLMPEIIITKDGSHSIYVPELDEHFHSVNGAVTESMHVFINAGFKQLEKNDIRVLELGFGTGLNALLTLIEASNSGKSIQYTGIEKYPLEQEVTGSLNFESVTNSPSTGFLNLIHSSPWGEEMSINPHFILKKLEYDMQELNLVDEFDLVYFDAFSPEKQPELWTKRMFSRIYLSMRQNAILTTYSSKGLVRRNMQAAGFRVEKIPGPLKKWEMTRAWNS